MPSNSPPSSLPYRIINHVIQPVRLGLIVWLIVLFTSSPAAAVVGDELCNTPLVTVGNDIAPIIITAVIMGGSLVGVSAHTISGLYAQPEQVKFYEQWRNRALKGAIGAPIIAYFLEFVLAALNAQLASCIELFPFGLG